MDYLNVGSNGFAQVGTRDYYAINRVEMAYLMEFIENKFPIPQELNLLCSFGVKAFPHEFGTYHEIVLNFDDDTIGDGSDEVDDWTKLSSEELKYLHDNNIPLPQAPLTLHDIFWDWFHEVEAFDYESEEITQAIISKYIATLDTSKSEHLTLKKAS